MPDTAAPGDPLGPSPGSARADPTPPDPLLHQPSRLEIMAYLYRSRQAGFTELRDQLALTAGNLQSHGEKLRAAGYIEMNRVLAGIFEVRWHITPQGDAAFEAYFQQMRALLERIAPKKRDES